MTLPNFSFERKAHKLGYVTVAGADEVGRGCFAGPVVAGCVVFGKKIGIGDIPVRIDDSKKLTSRQREIGDVWIRKNVLRFGIGVGSVSQINRLGIKKATEIAFRKAVKECGDVDFLLVDAFNIPFVKGLRRRNQKAIVHGDTKSISIAAASIIAKVYRDKLMTKLSEDKRYKKYLWQKNKGYGTKQHREAILKYGICKLHRKQFVETWQSKL